MKIAFLGKGGSGKSTLATALVRHLHGAGYRVLAIDADHNMDLAFNLGAEPLPFLGTDPSGIKRHLGTPDASFQGSLADAHRRGHAFRLSPPDAFTAAMSYEAEPGLLVMAAGPHTDAVRSGESCSHSLAAPLKAYLPLLALARDEAVVIDERAGTDPVATGILHGVDLAVIVAEPTTHSIRVATQIADELSIAGIPFAVVENKAAEDTAAGLPHAPIARVAFARDAEPSEAMGAILAYARGL